ncbi:hypothetical protein [Kribbella jiaozuonensis]|uniref:DUF998 domain-containing protein n=1 Tax=Kribbella jiaozuonensis TaxID=2575441 RepID=A0A4V5UX69_9ACTN|nr:hypothetical protein [Kribbella jiaozuonensis]TKK72803.1 hypothetical protein FDA38_41380 [Kribbella jiaozuonensis]TKK78483.1 hypothetical protein FDA38_25815 [Kribbella jiaozuonensis]
MTITAPQQTSVKRALPALGLFFLSPLVAEFLLGNIPITALFALIGLAPLYGGGAVLIREVVRRRGWGYPSVVILALAYGVLEEGITTQSLFNPNYAGQRLLDPGHIGFLGMGAPWTVFVLGLHTIWSITVPIVVVESMSRRRREPWLGKVGFSVYAALFVVGIIATTAIQLGTDSFVASPAQFAGVVIAIVVLVFVAARVGRRPQRRTTGTVPPAWVFAIAALALSSAWMVTSDLVKNAWLAAAVMLLIDAVAATVLVYCSRRTGWTQMHALAVAGGAMLTYAWHAFPEAPIFDAPRTADLIGNAVFALLAVALLISATIRCDKFGDS